MAGRLAGREPHPRGLLDRLGPQQATHDWRRDPTGRLIAFAALRAPDTRPLRHLRLNLAHPAHRRQGLGRALVHPVRERLGNVTLAAGQESDHFLPGAVHLGGFALTALDTGQVMLTSVLYPDALRRATGTAGVMAGLGPVGLHPNLRGRGHGRAFILAAMRHLHDRGAQAMGIDWTGIAPFHGRLGFRTWDAAHHRRGQASRSQGHGPGAAATPRARGPV